MAANTSTTNQAADFFQYLINNPHEREKLQDATVTDIVQAGKNAGYNFTENDLDAFIERVPVTVGSPHLASELSTWTGVRD